MYMHMYFAFMCKYTSVHIHIYLHTDIDIYTRIKNTYVHMHTYTCMYMCAYIGMNTFGLCVCILFDSLCVVLQVLQSTAKLCSNR